MAGENWRDFVEPSPGVSSIAPNKNTPADPPSTNWRNFVEPYTPSAPVATSPRIAVSATANTNAPFGKPGASAPQVPFNFSPVAPISRPTPGSAFGNDPISIAGPIPMVPEPDPLTPEQQEWYNLPFFSRLGAVSSNFGRAMPMIGPLLPQSEHSELFQRARPKAAGLGRFLGGAAPYAALAVAAPMSMATLPRAMGVGAGAEGSNDAIMSLLRGDDISQIGTNAATGAGRGAISMGAGHLLSRAISPRLLDRAIGARQGRDMDLQDTVLQIAQRQIDMEASLAGRQLTRAEVSSILNDVAHTVASDPRNAQSLLNRYLNNTSITSLDRGILAALGAGTQDISPRAETLAGNIGSVVGQGVQRLDAITGQPINGQ